MQVIGYIRVSTDEQQANGHGLDAQRAAITAEGKRRGWDVAWIEEVGSGKDMRCRPKLEAALALLDTHAAQVLVVAKLDRLFPQRARLRRCRRAQPPPWLVARSA